MERVQNIDKNEKLVVLEGLEGNQPTQLYGLQKILAPHQEVIIFFWWALFFSVIIFFSLKVLKAFYEQGL